MKKLFLTVPLLSLLLISSCKKENDDLIDGVWDMESIYIDGIESSIQYAGESQYPCDSYTLTYNPYYKIDEFSMYFSGTEFSKLESGYTYNAADDFCTSTKYKEEFQSNDWNGQYSISDEGKGDLISITMNEGYLLEVNIISLDKSNLSIEYTIEELKFRVNLVKRP